MLNDLDSRDHFPDYPFYPHDIDHDAYAPRKRLPIPDLRFEQVYLKRIQDCIHIEPLDVKGHPGVVEMEDIDFTSSTHAAPLVNSSQQIVKVDWGKVFYVTMRDQVMMPLLQGMLWGIIGTYYKPFIVYARGHLHASAVPAQPVEGEGVSWLRSWLKRLGFSSIAVGARSL